ncbi:MAG: Fe3+-hydroxamate ABC transporter substrate-binding protein [Acidobacteria bacterium]|nr:MAG: Fe3+-hydroxamate ABC transporter substrate-binding protein [Acidobacteriota bacterium]
MNFSHSPRRIVSLQPSATVILEAIGQLDRVVACTRYCVDVCPAIGRDRIVVDDSWTANASEIMAARPDLVIAAIPFQEKSLAEILKSGARFLGVAPKNLADIYTDIASIAGIMGVPERGEEVVRAMEGEIAHVREQAAALPRQRVFCEEWGKPVIASQKWVAELVEAAGGEFIATPGAQILPEAVVEADPDVLLAAWCGAGDRVPLAKIMRDRSWLAMRAVREGRVYCIRDELLNTPAPTLIAGLHALAAAMHPQQFPLVWGMRCITDVIEEMPVRNAPLV